MPKKINIYQVAYKNLLRKKTRSALTILGIGLSAWVRSNGRDPRPRNERSTCQSS